MILTRTVFVLGAGASHPYHMPLGLDLFAGARSIDPNHEVFQTYVQGPHETDRANAFNAFLGAVRKHPGPSLDAFLEDQPQHRDVGHVVIAGLMGQSIRLTAARPTPIDPSKDWLAYLINEMRSGTRGIGKSSFETTA